MERFDGRIAFLGGGHITEILVENLTGSGVAAAGRMTVSDPDRKRLETLAGAYGVATTSDNREAAGRSDLVFVNVPPDCVAAVVADLKEAHLSPSQVIITLAAGVPLAAYRAVGDRHPAVRALPNPPSRIGRGVVALAINRHVSPAQKASVMALFSSLGECHLLAEAHIDAVTALSSPATVYLFFEALAAAGVRAGLDRRTALGVAYGTITGAMAVWRRGDKHPAELISEASTPGGTSVESLFVLEKYAFRAAIIEAVCKAAEKATALGRAVGPG
jgi:pyrroline-5-carboxylate reductase